jgi:hypothetical protein
MNYLFAGLGIGMLVPQIVSDKNHDIIYSSLALPHDNFKKLKIYLNKNNLQLSYEHYVNYIKNVGYGIFSITSYFLYYKNQIKKFEKQQDTFDMIEDFEFVRESCENLDYIIDKTKKVITKHIEEENKKKEDQERMKIFSEDEENLHNIELIRNLAKDEYEKFLLNDAVMNTLDYYKELSPDFKLAKEKNRRAILEVYYRMVDESQRQKRGEQMLEKAERMRIKAYDIIADKMDKEEITKIEKIKQYNKLDVKEKPDLTKKFPNTVAEVENLRDLQEVFGDK